MSKRKTGAIRTQEQDTRHTQPRYSGEKTFFTRDSKNTIDFRAAPKQKQSSKPVMLVPKTVNQEKYIMALLDPDTDVVVVGGPAGTGKTYLAMLAAIKALKAGECDRIILTRPAVTVDDENHGFLPGDLNQKMEPWTRPALDVLREFYSAQEVAAMLEEQVIEISPLAYMRGRNFKNSFIVLDEGQNATPGQMKMLLTRIGYGSKIVITGDQEQTDRVRSDCGLSHLLGKMAENNVPGMKACEFELRDVQRHRIIPHILSMYKGIFPLNSFRNC